MKSKRLLFPAVFALFVSCLSLGRACADDAWPLLVFHSPGCHWCEKAKREVLPLVEKEFKGRIRIEYRDLTNINNYSLLLGLKEKYDKGLKMEIPIFFMNGKFLGAEGDLKGNLECFIIDSLAGSRQEEPFFQVDLVNRFKSFRLLGVASAGLTDGINPCAFTVIVFFISYLALQGYRKLELVVIGLSFILAVFCTYLLLGLGIFNFLYQLKGFWIVARVFNISVGAFSLALGGLAIYDLLKFRKTQKPEGMLLQLPQSIKNRIHSVIGMHYRKTNETGPKKAFLSRMGKLILSALISGFLVSILEAVCTGQLYLPTITFILKTTPLKLKAFIYLVVYNIMFVIPLFVIFLLALFGVTSAQFAQFIKKHMAGIKALMSVMFIGLGIFLIWRG